MHLKPQHIDGYLFRYTEMLKYGEIHFKIDHQSQLHAIIAIHNTSRGPAMGGCRCIAYHSMEQALSDALRLGRMMTYQAALLNLKHGGAKAVVIAPKKSFKREDFFTAFAKFVNSLDGQYIVAVDAGTSASDMDIIAKHTKYVTCTTKENQAHGGDLAKFTAHGVCRGIEAAVKFKLHRDQLENIHIAIQGAGHVGYYLAKELHALGAKVTMSDTNQEALLPCVDEFKVNSVEPAQIFQVDCDVFSPCAPGAVINFDMIKQLKAKIVAGSANNQLAHQSYAKMMLEHDILYAPDFVINAGGLIHVAAIYDKKDEIFSKKRINDIYQVLLEIFAKAKREIDTTNHIAEVMAREILQEDDKLTE